MNKLTVISPVMSDRVGGSGDDRKMPASSSWLSKELREAIEVIPMAEKMAYLRAVETVPDLVRIESPPEKLLSFNSFDPWAAAKCLVDYWESRMEVFGEERAFYPLRLLPSNGTKNSPDHNADAPPVAVQSALDEKDMELIKSGALMILPKDSFGRPVLLSDRSRLPNDPDLMETSRRLRCTFYIFNVIAQETGEGHEIAVISVFGNKTRRASVVPQLMFKGMTLFGLRQILPIAATSWHVVQLGKRNFVTRHVLPIVMKICEAMGSKKPKSFRVHEVGNERDIERLQEELQKAGFGLEGLPKLGLDGLWTIGCFKEWVESRLRLERRVYDAPSPLPLSGGGDGAASLGGTSVVGLRQLDEAEAQEEQVHKRRQAEAAYARRKRARRKINLRVLQDEVRRHQDQKKELIQTQEELKRLLTEAERIVRLHELTQESLRDHATSPAPSGYTSSEATASLSGHLTGLDHRVGHVWSVPSSLPPPGALRIPRQRSLEASGPSLTDSGIASDRAVSLILQQLSDQQLSCLMYGSAPLHQIPNHAVVVAGLGPSLASQESALYAALSSSAVDQMLYAAAAGRGGQNSRAMDRASFLASLPAAPASSSDLLRAHLLSRSQADASSTSLLFPGQL